MIILGVNYLTVTLSSALSADIIASFKDSGDAVKGQNTKIVASSAATTVVSTPNAGGVRRLTDLNIRALAANSGNVTATVKQTDGTTEWEVFSATLSPGDALTFDHQKGWDVASPSLLGSNGLNAIRQLYPNILIG
jgi:hypothetical protein